MPPAEWAFAACGATPLPGVPDQSHLSLKSRFDPAAEYVYSTPQKILWCSASATSPVVGVAPALGRVLPDQLLLESRQTREGYSDSASRCTFRLRQW